MRKEIEVFQTMLQIAKDYYYSNEPDRENLYDLSLKTAGRYLHYLYDNRLITVVEYFDRLESIKSAYQLRRRFGNDTTNE